MLEQMINLGVVVEVRDGYFEGYEFKGNAYSSADEVEGAIIDDMYEQYLIDKMVEEVEGS